jgi:hypothetical protein
MIVYDCLYPSDRPFLPRKPLEGCKDVLVDGQRFYAIKPNTGGARDLSRYDPAEARKWPALSPGSLCVADIESRADRINEDHRELRTDIRLHAGVDITPDLQFVRDVVNDVRSGSEGAPVGCYGILPTGYNVFNAVITGNDMELRRAREANDYAAIELVESLDCLTPVLYVNSTNNEHWQHFARWQIAECRRISAVYGIGLPIVPFIGPMVHPSAGRGYIAPSFWELQFRTLRHLGCDGVVAWYSGPDKIAQLDPYMHIASQIAKGAM